MPSPRILTDVRIRSLENKQTKILVQISYSNNYKAQSMANMIVISLAGMFTADITKSIVTRPAEGIDAAPTDATVAVKLK